MNSSKRLAGVAGILYLIVAICGGFAHLYARAAVGEFWMIGWLLMTGIRTPRSDRRVPVPA